MRKQNRTVLNIASGRMRFKRRLDLPMWHHDHLPKIVQLLGRSADRIERLINLKNCATLIKLCSPSYYYKGTIARKQNVSIRSKGTEI